MDDSQRPRSDTRRGGDDPHAALRQRLRAYYASKNVAKTDEDMDKAIAKYSNPDSGGFEHMWTVLENKYGPEEAASPNGNETDARGNMSASQQQGPVDAERAQHRERLVRFYKHYNVVRGDDEISVALDQAAAKANGFEKMWRLLTDKYGPEPPPPAAPAADSRPLIGGSQQGDNPTDPEVFRRLRRFYDRYESSKSDEDIRAIMKRYAASTGGFAEMWRILETKYGPEQKLDGSKGALSLSQKDRLVRFYKHYNTPKTDEELERTIAKYATAPGGYDLMWTMLEKRYGPEPPATGEFDTIRLDPALVNSSTHFITPRGLSLQDNERRSANGVLLDAHMTNERLLSTHYAQGMEPPARSEVMSAYSKQRRGLDPSLLHLTLLFSGANYDLYEAATADNRAAFRGAVEEQVAANAQVPVKQLRVTRVAHGSIVVDLDYIVPPQGEEQSIAVAETLTRRVDAGAFPVGIVRDAYRRYLRGNPVQLVAAGITVLGQGLMDDFATTQKSTASDPVGAARRARDISQSMRVVSASSALREQSFDLPASIQQQQRMLGLTTPGFNAAASSMFGGGTPMRDTAASAAGVYMGVDPEYGEIPAAKAPTANLTQEQREARLHALRTAGGATNDMIAAGYGMPSLSRNVDITRADANGMPWHTYDPRLSPDERRQHDWQYQQRRAETAQHQLHASPTRHASPSSRSAGARGEDRGWAQSARGGSPRGSQPATAPDRGQFLDSLWQQNSGIMSRSGRGRGGGAGNEDRTPAALRGLGLQTSNPLEHESGGDGGFQLGLLAPPGAMELHRMMSHQHMQHVPQHSPDDRGGAYGAGPSPRSSSAYRVPVARGGPRGGQRGEGEWRAGGGQWASPNAALAPSASPVPERPHAGSSWGTPAQRQYSPAPNPRGASYMYGVVDALNAR
jgi:hypothetical protein